MTKFFGFVLLFFSIVANGQSLQKKLAAAYKVFSADSQMRHATTSLYVIEAKTGKVVFDHNSRVGLAPASTQKIITAATAYELLGSNYQWKTVLGMDGKISNGTLNGDLYLIGSGDPTTGSWRYPTTKEEYFFGHFMDVLKKAGIRRTDEKSNIIFYSGNYEDMMYAGGWSWDDIGQYYGAGHRAFNWRENQFDILLKTGSDVGDPVEKESFDPVYVDYNLSAAELTTAKKGSGDNSYVFLEPNSNYSLKIAGTLPAGEKGFRVSAAHPDPVRFFTGYIGMPDNREKAPGFENLLTTVTWGMVEKPANLKTIHTFTSPPFDSVMYYFNRRSINLYGEALIRTIAYEKQGFGRLDSGLSILRRFWKERGIDENELNMKDGSGLSAGTRVTTHAEVEVLKYAQTRPWYNAFYHSIPEFNKMKMKSGTIADCKGFTGYHKGADGKEFIFSFIVNNYNGSSSRLVNKMYKVLDVLK